MLFRSMAALAVAVLLSSAASAGVVGSARLELRNIRLVILDGQFGNVVRTATGGFGSPTNPSNSSFGKDFRVTGSNTTSTPVVNLNGTFEDDFSSVNLSGSGALTFEGGGFNPSPVVVGSLSSPANFVRADADYSGSFLNLDGVTVGGVGTSLDPFSSGTTFVDFEVNQAGSQGGGAVDVNNTAGANFIASGKFWARFEYDIDLDLDLADSGNPAGFFTTASAGVSAQLSGGIPGDNLTRMDDDFNFEISLGSGGVSNSLSEIIPHQSAAFEIEDGGNYNLTFVQNSGVTIQQQIVPEPSSLAIFGVMGVAGLAVGRRKLKKS